MSSSILQTILSNVQQHGELVSQAMALAESKITNAEAAAVTAAEASIDNSPLVAQIESAFTTLQAQTAAFIAKHNTPGA